MGIRHGLERGRRALARAFQGAAQLALWTPERRSHRILYKTLAIARVSLPVTWILGPTHRVNPRRIELILNFACDLLCVDCSIQCRQAPSSERMDVRQIARFIRESVAQQRRWEVIRLIGGEPTLHPELDEILALLAAYKREHSPFTRLQLCTNGYRTGIAAILARVPPGIEIENNGKKGPFQEHHVCVNSAPRDSLAYLFSNYTNACSICVTQGLGLSPFGYYHCNIAAAIDRVFGKGIGRLALPEEPEPLLDSARGLCRYCGLFQRDRRERFRPGRVSRTWRRALEAYAGNAPRLARF
jgi:hypothetical protein